MVLNGQNVSDIDISTGNETECRAAKYYQPPFLVIFALRYY